MRVPVRDSVRSVRSRLNAQGIPPLIRSWLKQGSKAMRLQCGEIAPSAVGIAPLGGRPAAVARPAAQWLLRTWRQSSSGSTGSPAALTAW